MPPLPPPRGPPRCACARVPAQPCCCCACCPPSLWLRTSLPRAPGTLRSPPLRRRAAYVACVHLRALTEQGVGGLTEAGFAAASKAALARGLWRDFQAHPPLLLAAARLCLDYRVADTGLWASLLERLAAAGLAREALQLLTAAVRPGSAPAYPGPAAPLLLAEGSGGSGARPLVDRCAPALVRADDAAFAAVARVLLWGPLAALGAPGAPALAAAAASAPLAPSSSVGISRGAAGSSSWPSALLAGRPGRAAHPRIRCPCARRLPRAAARGCARLCRALGRARCGRRSSRSDRSRGWYGDPAARAAGAGAHAELAALARSVAAAHPSSNARAAALARVEDTLQRRGGGAAAVAAVAPAAAGASAASRGPRSHAGAVRGLRMSACLPHPVT